MDKLTKDQPGTSYFTLESSGYGGKRWLGYAADEKEVKKRVKDFIDFKHPVKIKHEQLDKNNKWKIISENVIEPEIVQEELIEENE